MRFVNKFSTVIIFVFILTLAASFIFIIFDTNIRRGVSVFGIPVGGLSKSDALKKLKGKYPSDFSGKAIILKCGSKTMQINYKELGVEYDYITAVDKAFKKGRSSNVLKNYFDTLSLLFNNSTIPIMYKFDEDRLKRSIDKISKEVETPFMEHNFTIKDSSLILQNGKVGSRIDRNDLKLKIETALSSEKNVVSIELKNVLPKPFSIEEIYKQVTRPAVDAKYETRDDGGYFVPQQDGMDFDKAKAVAIIKENKDNGKPYSIPLNILKPNIYSNAVEQQLFKDTLSSVASKMTNHDENRLTNLHLAASKINGVILNPNEIFSYNAYLGEVSYENGFREATIYSDGKLGRGIGGGVCQISSVLYNAALKANLEIIRRSNHSFTVDYLPLGDDAAFAGNEKDLRFKNNTGNPIKILSSVDYDGAYITISGTNPDKGLVISIENAIRKTIPFKTIRSVNPSLPDNTIMIIQKGRNGYEIDTYRVLSKNGRTIKREFIYKSKYAPLDQIEHIWSKQPALSE